MMITTRNIHATYWWKLGRRWEQDLPPFSLRRAVGTIVASAALIVAVATIVVALMPLH